MLCWPLQQAVEASPSIARLGIAECIKDSHWQLKVNIEGKPSGIEGEGNSS